MIAKFFIDRPIFAAVVSIVITLAGGLAAFTLPISQYPPVTPPTIQVDCNYPGASAKVVSETIAAPIEQRVNGVERMLYMSSQCTSDGSYTLTVTFEIGTNLDLAQVLVQNRVNLSIQELPDVVRATGITTRKRSPEILMTVAMQSPPRPSDEFLTRSAVGGVAAATAVKPPAGRYDQLYLSNYAVTRIREELSRLPGIADVTIFGQQDYSMRVWVDPEKLDARGLTAVDVVNTLRVQNLQVALGQLGASPGGPGEDGPTRIPLTMIGRLRDPEQFGRVVLKAGADGSVVRVRDIGRVELAAKSQDVANKFDGGPTIGLAVFLLSDANALETADYIRAKMAELKKDFPDGVDFEIGYDTTPFIRESIKEVFKSLRDAVILVALVVLVFLQNWRSALIPLATVPVAIVGTFAAMAALGFGLNNLTLFGLVLAVGIVVDDAIVVVEAVEHHISHGLQPRAATIAAMDEVAGPVVAVGVVLSAVFLPCAFLEGIVGQFFRQFALTIAVSTVLSTFNSLSLSPALAALLLKPKDARPDFPGRVLNFTLGWFFRLFNTSFALGGRGYVWGVGRLVRVPALVLFVYAGLVGLTGWWYSGLPTAGYKKGDLALKDWNGNQLLDPVAVADAARPFLQLPNGFIPQQDKGYLIASIQLPDAASAERTRKAMDKITTIALGTPGIRHVNAVAGNSFVLSAYGSNFGSMFIILDSFDNRRGNPDLYSEKVIAALRGRIAAGVPEAQVAVFGAPAVSGLGRAGGFKLMVEDRVAGDPRLLQGQTENLIEKANQQPGLVGLFTVYRTNSPQVRVKVDPAKASGQGVKVTDAYATMQASLGARYVNDFNLFGRTWQVNVQAEPRFRNEVADVRRLKIKGTNANLVPLGAIADVQEVTGPLVLTRYNMYPAAAINGAVAQGVSSGDAAALLKTLARRELPKDMAAEWTELTFIEERSRDTGTQVFGFAVLVVFLVLAALYESFALPFAVILVVPVCVCSSLVGVWLTTLDAIPVATFDMTIAGKLCNPVTWLRLAGEGEVLDVNLAKRIGVGKQDVNIFTQVGFVVLIGLACKNAILIVEFAKRKREAGADRRAAVLEACGLRLRPILMTSFAFVLGVAPLLVASGAGAEMRQALGTAVFSGMIGVTAFGIFLTPVFFVVVDWIADHVAATAVVIIDSIWPMTRVVLIRGGLGFLTPFAWAVTRGVLGLARGRLAARRPR